MALLVTLVGVALLVGVGLGALATNRRQARALDRVLVDTQPDLTRRPSESLQTAIERVDRALHRERGGADSARAAFDRTRAALDALPVGVVVVDGAGAVAIRNRAAEGLLGVRHADTLVEREMRTQVRAALGGDARQQTLQLFGPRRTVVVSALPVRQDGQVIGAVATIEDVTERSRLEAARTDFVANISHELKTPVGALSLLAETIVGEDDPDILERLAQRMVLESHRLNRIIDDLLELSRIELGEEAPELRPTALEPVVADAVDRVRHLVATRLVDVEVDDAVRGVVIAGDRRQLVSALANLIENGVKYSEAGSVVVVRARSDGDWVEVDVEDQGIGIPTRDLDRIFERFYRVDRARSRETGGTGLGLAIVRHVASNHGGSVSVRSQEGKGSVFTLRLPAAQPQVAVDLPEAG